MVPWVKRFSQVRGRRAVRRDQEDQDKLGIKVELSRHAPQEVIPKTWPCSTRHAADMV